MFLSVLFSLFITTVSFGQAITYEDFRAAIAFFQKEDFKGAFEKTSQLLRGTQSDSLSMRGIDSAIKSAFNSLQFIKSDSSRLRGMTITSDSSKTNILCFEYFDYKEELIRLGW